jgi:ABC-type amino acid transport substrate-binding protein
MVPNEMMIRDKRPVVCGRRALCILLWLGLAWLAASSSTWAETVRAGVPQALLDRELVIATKQSAPFAMKSADGHWEGISIALWQRIARQLHLHYRFVESDLNGMLTGAANGTFDAGIAAITITAEREAAIDFSQPFYNAGLGVAVPATHGGWLVIARSILSLGFIEVVLALAALLAAVGLLIWLFERRGNDQFNGGFLKGIGTGFWWSAVTMTTVGYGDKAPCSVPGRLLAVAWMFASVILISSFTAAITSALTASQLAGNVHRVSDLRSVYVGAVSGTSTTDYLKAQHIAFAGFATLDEALRAMANGKLDAVVYDRPLLAWMVKQDFASRLEVLPLKFEAQTYGIALPIGSPLREPIDRALLEDVHSDWWQQLLTQYLNEGT